MYNIYIIFMGHSVKIFLVLNSLKLVKFSGSQIHYLQKCQKLKHFDEMTHICFL